MERGALNDCGVAACRLLVATGSSCGDGRAVSLGVDSRLEVLDIQERRVAETVCMWPCGVWSSPSSPSDGS